MVTLTVRGLSVIYRDGHSAIQALEDINLCLKSGRILGVVGESGSGKTTLGKALMGLLPKHAKIRGSIRLEDQEILAQNEEILNRLRWFRIAMVFQNGNESLNPVYRIIDQVAEPLIQKAGMEESKAMKRAEELLMRMGLTLEEGYRFPHELSGGQIQRALMAMALILDPDVLILDEPTAALDAMTKSFMGGIIRQVAHQGKAILLTTHDLDLVRYLADEVVVLYLGQMMEILPGADLLSNPLHPYTLGLVRSYPTMDTTRDLGGIRGDAFYRKIDLVSEKKQRYLSTNPHGPRHPGPEPQNLREPGCLFITRCTQAMELCRREGISLSTVGTHQLRCLRTGIVDILELSQVSKRYEKVIPLHPTDLKIRAGEVFCLVGETGSGKTTLAMIAAGVLKPDRGSRRFDQQDMDQWIRRDYPSLARQISVIYQNPAESVSHRFNVFDIVAEPLRIQGWVQEKADLKDRVLRALTSVHLPVEEVFLTRYPHELNMGALQRICIARALVVEPKLLIADEPTSSLDPSVQAKVLKLLLDLQIEKGLTMLFVTHNIGLARKVADRIGVMLAGQLLEVGPAPRIFSHPLHPYTRLLIEGASSRVEKEHFKKDEEKNGECPFLHRCDRRKEICFRLPSQPMNGGVNRHFVRCHFPLNF